MTLSRFAVSIVLMVMIINVYSLIVKTLFGKIFKKRSGAKPRSSFSVALFRLAHQHQLVDAVRFPVLHGLLPGLPIGRFGIVEGHHQGFRESCSCGGDGGTVTHMAEVTVHRFQLPLRAVDGGVLRDLPAGQLAIELLLICEAAAQQPRQLDRLLPILPAEGGVLPRRFHIRHPQDSLISVSNAAVDAA